MDTLMYWVSRLDPIIRADRDEEVIVVFANRSGTEAECTYAGTSAVIGIRKSEVRVYGILGRGDKELLVVDTEAPPYAKLVVQREEDNTAADAPDPNARGNPDSGAGMGRGDSNPRGSSGFGGSFDSSSKEPEDSGRHTTHRRAGSGSSWRRDDLFIHDSRKEPKWKPSDSPAFYTQTAPSPTTPYSLRSRAAPVRSSTERPWHPNQLQASVGLQSGQLQHNHRGDAGFEGLVQGSNMSPSYAQEPWHFEDSPRSSLGYWMPQHSPGVSANDRWILPEETENDSQPVSDAQKRENRLSIRSDVSVWNNNPGRPPSAGAYRSPPQESTSRTIDRVVSAPREIDLSALHRPEPPKSRQANRSRGPERSNSSTAVNTDLGAVCRQLEDMEFRVKSTEVPYSSLGNKGEKYGLYGRGSGVRQRSLQPTPIDCDSEVGDRVLSRTAIPIAVDDNSWSGPRNHEAIEVQASNKASAELPILRPASRDRIVAGNEPSRGRHSERPPTSRSANMYREPVRSNSSANVEDRAISRGRRRGSRPSSGHPSTQPHDRQLSGSRRENQPEPEPVDLSQFRLIVEYPSENCPVHGSRSRSGTGHRGTPNVRPPSHNQGLSRRRSSNTRRSTQNTPVNPSRQQRSGSQAKPATQSKIERPKAKISTRAATAAPAQAVPEPTNSVSTIVSVESSVASPKKGEPKTPVAMVLVFDGDEEEEQKQFKTPVKCMDRDITKQPVSRPRSAVW